MSPTPTTPTTSTSTTKPKPEVDVDCLLNQKLEKCQTGASKPPKPSPELAPKPSPELALPNKLGQSQILAGIRPVKTAAKSCGSGTTVAVKFSVEGASGKVISAQALDEHANSTTGKCVAKAAERASFDAFAAKQQGFTFKFRL